MSDADPNEKLAAALEPLGRGEATDGKPIDLAKLAARARAKALAFARRAQLGRSRTAYELRHRRFKG